MCHQSAGSLSTAEDPPDVAVPVSANQLYPCTTISCSMNRFYCSLFFHPIIEQVAEQSTATIISAGSLLDSRSAASLLFYHKYNHQKIKNTHSRFLYVPLRKPLLHCLHAETNRLGNLFHG